VEVKPVDGGPMLLDRLAEIKKKIENELSVVLSDGDFADGREEIEHIFLHEACHAAVSHRVPWIHTLDEREHTALDELMARFLEVMIGKGSGMFVHSTEEFLEELQRYPVDITQEEFDHLMSIWEDFFWLQKDLAGMAAYTLAYLRYGEVIYHILPRADWEKAQGKTFYAPPNMAAEGFIHFSEARQVIRVANAYYTGETDMWLLCISVGKLEPEIRYEGPSEEGEKFPHVYGPLNLDAVVGLSQLEKDEQGRFVFPGEFQALKR
jgi:uncharacterized protein (DUF952 family)